MSYWLEGKNRVACLNVWTWPVVLQVAEEYGWQPMGTQLDTDETEWSGTYLTNGRQMVTAEDARNLAAALRRFLEDYPTNEALASAWITHEVRRRWETGLEGLIKPFGDDVTVHYPDPIVDVRAIRALVELAEAGSFDVS